MSPFPPRAGFPRINPFYFSGKLGSPSLTVWPTGFRRSVRDCYTAPQGLLPSKAEGGRMPSVTSSER